jgi:hypothetical protein
MKNVDGDTLRGTKVDVEGFDFKLATVDDSGCRGAGCDRVRERDLGGEVAGWATEN